MSDRFPRWALWSGAALVAVLVWLFAYALPRLQETRQLREAGEAFERDRGRIAEGLASYAGLRRELPDPAPNVSGWLSQNSLKGMENHLDFNNPYREGKGAQIKLRNVRAEQVARFLSDLRRVNLVVDKMTLIDRDGDGRWDLEAYLEVPQP